MWLSLLPKVFFSQYSMTGEMRKKTYFPREKQNKTKQTPTKRIQDEKQNQKSKDPRASVAQVRLELQAVVPQLESTKLY